MKNWKHVSCVADEFIKDDRNIKVWLLIGADCNRDLESIKVIAIRNDGPYVMNSVLGGSVLGPIGYRNQSEEKVSGNRTAKMQAGSDQVDRLYFAVENKVTPDDDVKSMLKKIHEQHTVVYTAVFTGNSIYTCVVVVIFFGNDNSLIKRRELVSLIEKSLSLLPKHMRKHNHDSFY